ncbi:MAG: hypothetical protein COV46_03115 [Deltaproteobacteria bacterium CG11_big_fil_rev_8_21_14_0_20_49_13]|nr:MAG: hypothetical protein COV46_03115 [Deltaproteobacteria bacterium CG11_big_fil_rev_8_21_14_0_20_49_13]
MRKLVKITSLRAPKGRNNLVVWIASSLTLLAMTFAPSAFAEVAEKVVAIVGSEIITLYDLDAAMASHLNEINKSVNKELKYKDVRARVLEKMIDNLLMNQAMESSNIAITNDDIARYIKNILAQNHMSIEALKAEIAAKGISYETYKEQMRANIKRMRFINQDIGSRVKISDQDLRDYYEKHLTEFGSNKSAHIAQIVLPFEPNTTKEEALQMKARATEIVKQARLGTSFAALSKQYSKGPNSENGGDLGIVDPGRLLPEIAKALEQMKPGQISDPIISPAGVHVIDLIDRAQATKDDFEKMKEKIYEKMYDQRVNDEINAYVTELKKKTYIEIKE